MLLRLEAGDIARRRDCDGPPAGYAHPSYAAAMAEFGAPLALTRSRGWLLARGIPGSKDRDAKGLYPFFACANMALLRQDLTDLEGTIVSVAVVPDPFSVVSLASLESAFDIVRPFKTHYLVDLDRPFETYLRRHHRRYAGRALSSLAMDIAVDASAYTAEWADLYKHLVARHRLTGISAFTPGALSLQLAVPGCRYFRALHQGSPEGALVCYLDRGVAYAHLVSTTPKGQDLLAQYALYRSAIDYFRGRARWFALGSVPGLDDSSATTGLGFFKAGWATATCRAYFCGRILDKRRYGELSHAGGRSDAGYFPAYRDDVSS